MPSNTAIPQARANGAVRRLRSPLAENQLLLPSRTSALSATTATSTWPRQSSRSSLTSMKVWLISPGRLFPTTTREIAHPVRFCFLAHRPSFWLLRSPFWIVLENVTNKTPYSLAHRHFCLSLAAFISIDLTVLSTLLQTKIGDIPVELTLRWRASLNSNRENELYKMSICTVLAMQPHLLIMRMPMIKPNRQQGCGVAG